MAGAVIRWARSLTTARASAGGAESGSPSVHRTPRRLVAFGDGVFAITVTLLVLEIKPPKDYNRLLQGLGTLWPSYFAYALTFLFIGQLWANHHVMYDPIRIADRVILLLNTVLLMIVAFLPLATSVLAGAVRTGHGLRTAVAWRTTGALLGLAVPFLGLAVVAAFNAFYWLPIRGESPGSRSSKNASHGAES